MRMINADELINIIAKQIRCDRHEITCGLLQAFIEQVEAMPTVDAVEVVRCRYCIMHNNCTTEDAFKLCGIEDPFCCAGKRKEPVKLPEEEDSFLMQRFLKVE